MKKKGRALALALTMAMVLAACAAPDGEPVSTPSPTPAPSPQAEARMTFALPYYPNGGFHPIHGTNRLNLTLAPLIYRGLFAVDGHFQAQNDLCESYTVSEDGLLWTFRLVEAIFSDGSSLTPKEVAQSLNTARRSDRYSGRLKDLTRVWAEGDTVKVALSRPNGALPLLLDVPVVKEGEDPQRPLGTGPYALTEEGEELCLTARQGAQVPIDSIALRAVQSGDDLVYAFDAQEVSLVETDLLGTSALGYSGRLETTDYPTSTLLYLGCNMTAGACRDQAVRQAVALTLDRQRMVSRVLLGHAVATPLPVHPNAPGYDRSLAEEWTDPQRGLTLLEEAGWSRDGEGKLRRRGNGLTLRLIVNLDNTFKTAAAEELAADLTALGCEVTVDKLSWEEYLSALESRDFDLFLGETTMTPDFDLEPLLGWNGGLNYTGFGDGETWELMERNRAARDGERERTQASLCERVAQMAPIIPLCFKNGSLLTQWGQTAGAEPTQRDVFAGLENWVIRNF